MQKTKSIATLGPACEDVKTIHKMLLSGLSVFRINSSHLQNITHIKNTVKNIRQEAQKLDKPISIIMDLGGPKIRVSLPKNNHIINIIKNTKYRLGFNRFSST